MSSFLHATPRGQPSSANIGPAGDRNLFGKPMDRIKVHEGIQGPDNAHNQKAAPSPRPPQSARRHEGIGPNAVGAGVAGLRPLVSARGRLETQTTATSALAAEMDKMKRGNRMRSAAGKPDHASALQYSHTSAQLHKKLHKPTSDGHCTRFRRRQKLLTEIQRHDRFTQLSEIAHTPAEKRCVELQGRLSNVRSSVKTPYNRTPGAVRVQVSNQLQYDVPLTERDLVKYELREVERELLDDLAGKGETCRQTDRPTLRGIKNVRGGRDATTNSEDVVLKLFDREKQRKRDLQCVQHAQAEGRERGEPQEGVIAQIEQRKITQESNISHNNSHKLQDHIMAAGHTVEQQTASIAETGHHEYRMPQELAGALLSSPNSPSALSQTKSNHSYDGAMIERVEQSTSAGHQKMDDIPRVTLTGLQSEMLVSSLLRQTDEAMRKKEKIDEKDRKNAERLRKVHAARVDALKADELRRDRAREREMERHRRNPLEIIPDERHNSHFGHNFAEHIRSRISNLRTILIDLASVPAKREELLKRPCEEWDDGRIRRISGNGYVSTVSMEEIEKGQHRYFVRLVAVARDRKSNLVMADPQHHCVRRVHQDGTEEIVAGSGESGHGGFADGTASEALFFGPTGLTIDHLDNIYVADFYNHRIRKISATDGIVSTIAGTGVAGYKDGEASQAMLDHPESLSINSKGELLIADWGNHRIRKLSLHSAHVFGNQDPKPYGSSGMESSFKRAKALDIKLRVSRKTYSLSRVGSVASTNSGWTKSPPGSSMNSTSPPKSRAGKIKQEWVMTTVAGNGERGSKDEIGEAAKLNFPHGIFVEDDGETLLVIDSHMDGGAAAKDDLEAASAAAELHAIRQRESDRLADIAECVNMLRDGDFMAIDPDYLLQGRRRQFNNKTLGKLWRLCNHEASEIDARVRQKERSALHKGMQSADDIAQRMSAARQVEFYNCFQFQNVLNMLRGRDLPDTTQLEMSATNSVVKKMVPPGHQSPSVVQTLHRTFDEQIITATLVEVDRKILHMGPKQLQKFRLELSKRFNSVFDAWIFFDMDGDGSMSYKEFVLLCKPLCLPSELDSHEIFELVDSESEKEITPLTFVRVLAWHKCEPSNREMLLSIANSREKRQEIYDMAVRRSAELNEDADATAAATENMLSSKANTQTGSWVKRPTKVPTYSLPRSLNYPHYDPLTFSQREEADHELKSHKVEIKSDIPQELKEMNESVSIKLGNLKSTGMKKIENYDHTLERVGKMLSEKYIKRGRVWRLRDGGHKDNESHWDTFLMVLTEKGQLCFEPDDATHIHTPSGKKTILGFDMVNVVKHETVEIACLGGWAMELVFRTSAGKPSGLRWTKVRRHGSKGKELIHPQLAAALRKKTEFTQEEWDEFEITDLAEDDYIKTGRGRDTTFYKVAVPRKVVQCLCISFGEHIISDEVADGEGNAFVAVFQHEITHTPGTQQKLQNQDQNTETGDGTSNRKAEDLFPDDSESHLISPSGVDPGTEKLFQEWWSALRKFTWRVDDISIDHATRARTEEEQALLDEIELDRKKKHDSRRAIKLQRWFRAHSKRRREQEQAVNVAMNSHAEVHRLAYVLQQHCSFVDKDQTLINTCASLGAQSLFGKGQFCRPPPATRLEPEVMPSQERWMKMSLSRSAYP